MGFDDLFNKGKQLFEDGKEKVTDFVESEKGEQLIDKSKKLFEDGKDKVTDFVESDKGEQSIDKSKNLFEDGKEKVTDFFDGDKGDEVLGNEPTPVCACPALVPDLVALPSVPELVGRAPMSGLAGSEGKHVLMLCGRVRLARNPTIGGVLRGERHCPMSGILVHEWLERTAAPRTSSPCSPIRLPDAARFCLWNDSDGRFAGIQETALARTPLHRHKMTALAAHAGGMAPSPERDADWVLCSSHPFAHHARLRAVPPASAPKPSMRTRLHGMSGCPNSMAGARAPWRARSRRR